MSTVSVRTHFAAGHRILGLEGAGSKCRNLHGHTFHVEWTYAQDEALEFGTMKEALRGLVKRHFDHGFIIDRGDDLRAYLSANMLRHYLLDGPPTTERIAAEIARLSIDRFTKPYKEYGGPIDPAKDKPLYPDSQLLKVKLDEGPENSVTWEASPPPVGRYASGGVLPGIPNLPAGQIVTGAFGGGGGGGGGKATIRDLNEGQK